MITNQDFEIPEGDTRSISIPLKTSDGVTPYTVPLGARVLVGVALDARWR
jgi:hypothetical protein